MPQTRIHVGPRVMGLFGPLAANLNGNKQRIRTLAVGTVLSATDKHKWIVLCNWNWESRECSSGALKIVPDGAGVLLKEL